MPKDPTRNQPNYKIGGSHLNEFEFQQNQGAMAEEERARFARQEAERRLRENEAGREDETSPTTTQTEAERIKQLMADVHERVQREKAKAQKLATVGEAASKKRVAGGKTSQATSKGTATKSAGAGSAQGGAKKRAAGTKKAAAKKVVKSGAKRRGVTKAGAKKAGSKKAATKVRTRSAVAKKSAGVRHGRATAAKAAGRKSAARKSSRQR